MNLFPGDTPVSLHGTVLPASYATRSRNIFSVRYPAAVPDPTTPTEDGRHARRRRNRDAVIDALFDLLNHDGHVPDIDAIAERAGVSVSSIFRYFDGLEDLKIQTAERYFIRYAELFEIPTIGGGALDQRIEGFVTAKTSLYDAIAPIGRLARAKAYDQPTTAVALARARTLFREQIEQHFAPELAARSTGDALGTIATVDAFTSFESWDLHTTIYRRSNAQIRASWTDGLGRLLDVRA